MTADGEVCQEAQAPGCSRCMGLGDGALALLRQLASSGTQYLSTAVFLVVWQRSGEVPSFGNPRFLSFFNLNCLTGLHTNAEP